MEEGNDNNIATIDSYEIIDQYFREKITKFYLLTKNYYLRIPLRHRNCLNAMFIFVIIRIIHKLISYPSIFSQSLLNFLKIDTLIVYLFLIGHEIFSFSSMNIRILFFLNLPHLLVLLLLIVYIKYVKKTNLSSIGPLNPFKDKNGLLITLSFIIIFSISIFLFPIKQIEKISSEHIYRKNVLSLMLLIVPFLEIAFSTFTEEVLSRGFLQRIITENYGKIIGIFLSSIIFTFSHFESINNILNFLSIFILSLLLGYLYSRKNNLSLPILFHFSNNILIWFTTIYIST